MKSIAALLMTFCLVPSAARAGDEKVLPIVFAVFVESDAIRRLAKRGV